MEKTKLALLFGGMSSEHDVSCVSAATVAGVLDPDKYDVTYIGGNAFRCCMNLTSVTIGDHVRSIGLGAFMECSNITSIIIGEDVTSIALLPVIPERSPPLPVTPLMLLSSKMPIFMLQVRHSIITIEAILGKTSRKS